MIGVYAIRFKRMRKLYIGGSTDIVNRWSYHIAVLKQGTHHCAHLQEAYTYHGADNLVLVVLEHTTREDLRSVEQRWLDTKRKWLYNTQPNSTSRGTRHSTETKRKLSLAAKNRSQEYRKALSERVKLQHRAGKFGRATLRITAEEMTRRQQAGRKPMSEIHQRKMVEASIARRQELWQDPEWSAMMRKKLSENAKK